MGLLFSGIFAGTAFLTCAWKAVVLWRYPAIAEGQLTVALSVLGTRPDVRRGMVRSIVLVATACLFISLMAISGMAAESAKAGSAAQGLWLAGIGVSGAGVLLATLVQVIIIYFNRPQFLVPPHMRGEPGVLADRRQRRAAAKEAGLR